jgi:hypothetical protein
VLLLEEAGIAKLAPSDVIADESVAVGVGLADDEGEDTAEHV